MQRLVSLGLILTAVFIMALGCDEVTDEEDTAAAQALADSAIGVFEDELANFIDAVETGDIDSPYDLDFTSSNAFFKEETNIIFVIRHSSAPIKTILL